VRGRLDEARLSRVSAVKIVVLTDIPSPYQVELFNGLARLDGWSVSIIYSRRSDRGRVWQAAPILHESCFLHETSGSKLAEKVTDCDLAVFGGYRPARIAELMKLRNRTRKAWAFWGERPGFRFPGWFGRHYRAWALREVRSSRVPVWGIGEWGVDGYRSELGDDHSFYNVPYCSNLAPFFAIKRRFSSGQRCRFLFSGSFIRRKGVDLLASAFARLIEKGVDAELHVLGSGPLGKALEVEWSRVPGKVRVHGFKQWGELASVYAQADVLCAPSRHDGWGLVVVEGLAAGMPVIATDRTGAARELIAPENGWLVPAGDENALHSAIWSAATLGIDRRESMSDCARRSARRQDLDSGVRRFAQAAEMTVLRWMSTTSLAGAAA